MPLDRPLGVYLALSSETNVARAAMVRRSKFHVDLNGLAKRTCQKVAQQSRRFAATSAAHKHIEPRRDSGYIDDDEVDDVSGRGGFASRRDEGRSRPTAVPYPKVRQKADPRPLVEHLENLFPSLKFPDVVASQALTHISAKEAWAGHNARLSFVGKLQLFITPCIPAFILMGLFKIGRRVLSAYLLLFIHSASRSRAASAESQLDFDLVSYRTLFTPFIGEKSR